MGDTGEMDPDPKSYRGENIFVVLENQWCSQKILMIRKRELPKERDITNLIRP